MKMKSKQALDYFWATSSYNDTSANAYETIERDLQILEIIKNKLVFPLALMSLPYELYNKSVMKEQQLTQEEYDKIKWWLRNDK